MKLLLENGAQPDFEDENGQTPFSWAVEGGDVDVLHLLIAKGAKINTKYNIVSELMANTATPDFCSG